MAWFTCHRLAVNGEFRYFAPRRNAKRDWELQILFGVDADADNARLRVRGLLKNRHFDAVVQFDDSRSGRVEIDDDAILRFHDRPLRYEKQPARSAGYTAGHLRLRMLNRARNALSIETREV
jgi:hypothetical protein